MKFWLWNLALNKWQPKGLIIKILKFLGIPPIYDKSYSCFSSIFFSPIKGYDGNVSDNIEGKGGSIAASKPGMNEDEHV